MDWNSIFTTLGSTAIVVAAIGFVAKSIFNHLLSKASAEHSNALQVLSNEKKAALDSELKRRTDAFLLEQKAAFDKQLEIFKADVASSSAKEDRIRDEVVRWANPILISIEMLRNRLDNILDDDAHSLLSPASDPDQSSGWSAAYEYFFPSTLFLFCQYFCWTRLLEEDLSFEMFEKHEVKDAFFARLRNASSMLSKFPLDLLEELPGGKHDRQVFTLQQRLLGEIVAVDGGNENVCMRYAQFLEEYDKPQFKNRLQPLIKLLEGVQPADQHRWRRLELFRDALKEVSVECRRLLNIG